MRDDNVSRDASSATREDRAEKCERDDVGDLLSSHAPAFTVAQAEQLARDGYGLSGHAVLLTSERDQNFALTTADGTTLIVKVTNPAEDPLVTDFQTAAQLHLARAMPDLPIPHIRLDLNDAPIHWHTDAGGVRRAVRVMRFLPGQALHKTERSEAQMASLGALLARFNLGLADFRHPAAGHELLWDLQHAHKLRPLIAHVHDARQRDLATRFMDAFERNVVPALSGLRRQIVHNDLNPYNIFVDHDDPSRVTGLIDFGDMVEAPLIDDLAVACAYQLEREGQGNPFGKVLACVGAYHAVNPLTPPELTLLPALAATRLLITVLITGWRAVRYPENRTYILRNNPLAWNGLQRLADTPPEDIAAAIAAATSQ